MAQRNNVGSRIDLNMIGMAFVLMSEYPPGLANPGGYFGGEGSHDNSIISSCALYGYWHGLLPCSIPSGIS